VEFCRGTLRQDGHLSVLPTGLIGSDLEAGRLVVLAAPGFAWRRPVNLVYRAESIRVPAVLAMIRALHEVAERAMGASPGVAGSP
jgi:DNA-binding transcriptional LysR family regulator